MPLSVTGCGRQQLEFPFGLFSIASLQVDDNSPHKQWYIIDSPLHGGTPGNGRLYAYFINVNLL